MQKRGPKTHKPAMLKFDSIDHAKLIEAIDFKKYIYDETTKALSFAIKNNKKKIIPFKIEGIGTAISISQEKFQPILDNMILFYEKQENFKKCDELVKLKGKCNGK